MDPTEKQPYLEGAPQYKLSQDDRRAVTGERQGSVQTLHDVLLKVGIDGDEALQVFEMEGEEVTVVDEETNCKLLRKIGI